MKRLGITQRVHHVESYGERRDCLDQRWSELALELDFLPVPLPNLPPTRVANLIEGLGLDALVLSGGNSILRNAEPVRNAAPQRDAFEAALLDAAGERNIPVFGVCRGLQMINVHLGGRLEAIRGHAGTRHDIIVDVDPLYHLPTSVNSYHDFAIPADGLARGLRRVASDVQGYIEAFRHEERPIFAIMWHPERETPFNPLDLKLMKSELS